MCPTAVGGIALSDRGSVFSFNRRVETYSRHNLAQGDIGQRAFRVIFPHALTHCLTELSIHGNVVTVPFFGIRLLYRF